MKLSLVSPPDKFPQDPLFTDSQIRARVEDRFLEDVHNDGALESWLSGHQSDAEILARLHYFRDRALANVEEQMIRELEAGRE